MNIINKIIAVCKNCLLSIGTKVPKVMNSKQTIEYILNNGASIGRYEDGEISLINGKGLRFQTYNSNLAKRLCEIKNTNKFLTCIPNVFNKENFNKEILKKDEFEFWKKHKLAYSHIWKKLFANQVNGDALMSRFYIRYADSQHVKEYVDLFKKLWEGRNLIIVEGENSKIGCENDLLNNSKSVRRILCPTQNAFDVYQSILENVKNNYNKDDLVLIALGPTATVLAYDLSELNIQALDLGHFDIEYEWFIANAQEKIPVKNKHVNEWMMFD